MASKPLNTDQALLRHLAIKANNLIMRGLFSGDDMREAVDIMNVCMKIVEITNDEETEHRPD